MLATKFGMDMGGAHGPDWDARGSRRYIRKAVESSLRRLRTDWIDLYQFHAPGSASRRSRRRSRRCTSWSLEGKVRYIGSLELRRRGRSPTPTGSPGPADLTRFISAQNQYSLLERAVEAELVPACERFGVGILPYFPLASGLLTGKYRRGEAAPAGTRLAGRDGLAHRRALRPGRGTGGVRRRSAASRMLDVAIGGLAAQPAVSSVIAGATTPEQVAANVAAGAWVPTPSDLAALQAHRIADRTLGCARVRIARFSYAEGAAFGVVEDDLVIPIDGHPFAPIERTERRAAAARTSGCSRRSCRSKVVGDRAQLRRPRHGDGQRGRRTSR